MSKAILSAKYPQFTQRLSELGYEVIPSETVGCFIDYEQQHADMQCLILDDTAFVLSCCRSLANTLSSEYNVVLCADDISGEYPQNVALNAAVLGKNLICRVDSLDDKVKAYCKANDFTLINVKQGYAKCSCAVVSDNAVITEDVGIYRTLSKTDIEVLLIGKGSVTLEGADCGFIGGASGYDKSNNTLYFCGDICEHPDFEKIKGFCDKHGTKIECLSDSQLLDIGGILFC